MCNGQTHWWTIKVTAKQPWGIITPHSNMVLFTSWNNTGSLKVVIFLKQQVINYTYCTTSWKYSCNTLLCTDWFWYNVDHMGYHSLVLKIYIKHFKKYTIDFFTVYNHNIMYSYTFNLPDNCKGIEGKENTVVLFPVNFLRHFK